MRLNLAFLILLFFSTQSFSTAQAPDKLIIDGETITLQSNPLEVYFKSNPDKKSDEWAISTALWRGYVAEFKIGEPKGSNLDFRHQRSRFIVYSLLSGLLCLGRCEQSMKMRPIMY